MGEVVLSGAPGGVQKRRNKMWNRTRPRDHMNQTPPHDSMQHYQIVG